MGAAMRALSARLRVGLVLAGLLCLGAAGPILVAGGGSVLVATKAITATEIVGTAAGDLGHADGVELVPAVAGKVIIPLEVYLDYNFATAAYTDGGNLRIAWSTFTTAINTPLASTSTFTTAESRDVIFFVNDAGLSSTSDLAGQSLRIRSDAAWTNPGTAAGTATLKTVYILVDAQ